MSTYLVIMDPGASALELRNSLRSFVSSHRSAQLVLLQAMQPCQLESDIRAIEAAATALDAASQDLRASGIPVVEARVGDRLPRKAIAKELSSGRHAYTGIVLPGANPENEALARQLERRFRLPVIEVEAPAGLTNEAPGPAWALFMTMPMLFSR